MNIFIDTEDMEERYGEQLYYDFLIEQSIDLQQRIKQALEITNKILMNNADNRMICNDEEKEYFDWLDKEMLKQERILKGDNNGD